MKKKTKCVLHSTNFSRKKRLFFSRLKGKTKAWNPPWSCAQHCCACLLSSCCWTGLRSGGRFLPGVEQGRKTWFAAGFGICCIPWAISTSAKPRFPGVRISAEVQFDVFNWHHHVHWWKITGQEWTARIPWIFNREGGSRHRWRCWGGVDVAQGVQTLCLAAEAEPLKKH